VSAAPELAEEIGQLDGQLEAIETHEQNWSPQAIKRRRAELTSQLAERTAEQERTKAEVAQSLTDATAEIEARYVEALTALSEYLDAAEAVLELRPSYDTLHRQARTLGIELPPRIEPFTVQAAREYSTKTLFQRAERLRFTW
jgi:hypothetical protein